MTSRRTSTLPDMDAGTNASATWTRGFTAFRHYNYRLYFGGQLVSLIGTWMQNIGQGWLVLQLTHSPFYLGVVTALQSLPVLFFALLGGVVADRFPKNRLLVVTQSTMALLALVLALDVSAGTVRVWHIYILATLLGLVQSVDAPTRQAFGVEMVGKDDLLNAIALNSALYNSARIFGPAIAGVLIAVAGMAACFYLNSLSFLAVIAALLVMRPAQFHLGQRAARGGSVRGQLGEGLGFVRRTPIVLMVMALICIFSIFAFNFNVILPVFADSVLHIGVSGYGALSSAMGVGSLIAAVSLAFARRTRWPVMLAGIGSFVIFGLAFSWSRNVPLSLVLLAGMGASTMIFTTQANTTVQTLAPDALRGRVMSLYMMLFMGSQPVGAFLTGSLASIFSAPIALTAGAAVCAMALVGAVFHGPGRSTATPAELAASAPSAAAEAVAAGD